jgi:hypothetical protein
VPNVFIDAIWRGEKVKRGAQETVRDLGGIDRGMGALKGAAMSLGPVMAAALGGATIIASIRSTLRGIADEEAALSRLTRTMSNMGVDVGATMASVHARVRELQDSTAFSDDSLFSAFQSLAQGTQDVSASLLNLDVVVDLAVARQIDLATSSDIVAKALEGNTRAVAMQLPFLKSLAAELENVADPAERAARLMSAIRDATGGQAVDDVKTLGGAWRDFVDQIGEANEGMLRMSRLPELIKSGLIAATEALKAEMDPRRKIPAGVIIAGVNDRGSLGPGVNPSWNDPQMAERFWKNRQAYDAPIGPENAPPMFWDQYFMGPESKSRRGGVRGGENIEELMNAFGNEVPALTDKWLEDWRTKQQQIGSELQSILIGGFQAGRGGVDQFVSYFREQLISQIFTLLSGLLVNSLFPGAGASTGLLGKVFGAGRGGASADNASRRFARVGI